MYDVKEIQRLYAKYGSMRQVAREMKISRNTVSKYLKRVKEFRNGKKSKVICKIKKPKFIDHLKGVFPKERM